MDKNECNILFSKYFPFWDQLKTDEKRLLCENTYYKTFVNGENIHSGNGECTGTIMFKNGSARVYLLSDEGREITLYRLFAGDMCMLSASCVIQSVTFDVFVDADEDCECYILNSSIFSALAKRNVLVENFALNMAVIRFSDVIFAMQEIMFKSFDKRLAGFLYDEVVKNDNLTVHMTQEQIAKYLSSAREVVSRMLKYFANEKIVTISRGGVTVIDKDKLKTLALS